jgi:radical S-adenosyl methionine domain-containing protein 2
MNAQYPRTASGAASPRPPARQSVEDLVINWHVTEACNYRCRYCYAHWSDKPQPRELCRDQARSLELLEALHRFFRPDNRANPIAEHLHWRNLRLNLAGGEPLLLGKRLPAIFSKASELGFTLSIITNGALLTGPWVEQWVPHLTCLGISLDSASTATNQQIGRADRRGRQLDLGRLQAFIEAARRRNPRLQIKINTVVNQCNWAEDFSQVISQLRPDRWKILRGLPVLNEALAISNVQFRAFVDRHRCFSGIACVEDHEDMTESYLMVDPHGRFLQKPPAAVGPG